MATTQNPLEWTAGLLSSATSATGSAASTVFRADEDVRGLVPAIRRIHLADLGQALAEGVRDFKASRTDVLFLCVFYPLVGLLLARMAIGENMLPLIFPLLSGFALIGPLAGTALYDMSRQIEAGHTVSWADAFGVLRAPRFGAIVAMGVVLFVLFAVWIAAAQGIYDATLGPKPPVSIAAFAQAVATTPAGWQMIGIGMFVGFLFALTVLATSVVSIPLMLDRGVGLDTAIWTSIRVTMANPVPIAAWGLIVAVSLMLGSISLLFGLAIVLPVLGHATWHLYRRVVAR